MNVRHSTLLLLCLCFSPVVVAQIPGTPYVFELAGPAERLGADVVVLGDVNGNGSDDFVVGAPAAAAGTFSVGRLRAVDGLTLQQIWVVTGTLMGGDLGRRLARTPDLDGDGVDDLVASQGPNAAAPVISWYSGASGALLGTQTLTGQSGVGNEPAVIPWRDWNGDGIIDYAVGGLRGPLGGRSVLVVDRQAGVLTTAPLPPTPFNVQGTLTPLASLLGTEDLNGDGVEDLVVGDPGFSSPGLFYRGVVDVLDGATLQLLWTVIGTRPGGNLGASLVAVDDLDGDGVRDVVAGQPDAVIALAPSPGSLRVLSGASGSAIYDLLSPTLALRSLGSSVVNLTPSGTGVPNILMAATLPRDTTIASGPALMQFSVSAIVSGIIGTEVRALDTQFSPSGSQPTVAVGDVNGDGFLDQILGVEALMQRSTVHVFRGSGSSSFTGPNPLNQTLVLLTFPSATPVQSTWRVFGPPALGGQPGLIVAGLSRGVAPVFATTLLVDVSVPGSFVTIPFSFDLVGNLVVDVTSPGMPIPPFPGLTLFAQAFAFDPTALQGLISSNGLQITL